MRPEVVARLTGAMKKVSTEIGGAPVLLEQAPYFARPQVGRYSRQVDDAARHRYRVLAVQGCSLQIGYKCV